MTISLLLRVWPKLAVRTASAWASSAGRGRAAGTGRSSLAAADWSRSPGRWSQGSGWSWRRWVCLSTASCRKSWSLRRRRPAELEEWRSPLLALEEEWAVRGRGWRKARWSSWSSAVGSVVPQRPRMTRLPHSPGRRSWTMWPGSRTARLPGCCNLLLLQRTAETCPPPPGRRVTGWPGRTWRSGGRGRTGPGRRWGSRPEGRGSLISAGSLVSASVCTCSRGDRSCVELGSFLPRRWKDVSELQSAFSIRIRDGGKFPSYASLGFLEQFCVVVFWTRPWRRSSVFLCAPSCLCQASCWRGRWRSLKLQMIEETSGSWRTWLLETRTCPRSSRRTCSPDPLLTCWTCCAWQTLTCWGHC